MRGRINGIWLTTPNGKLHPNIIPNLSSWIADAKSCRFEVDLWTNTNELAKQEITRAKTCSITIRDHSECSTSSLYKYFLFFLEKGIHGDKTAFALASDILRMAVLELAPDSEYFIYIDPNDVRLVELKFHLTVLDRRMANNPLGFSFFAEPVGFDHRYHLRNDVLIALKAVNKDFFNSYIKAYSQHLKRSYQQYFTPTTDGQAQRLAAEITNKITDSFFSITVSEIPHVVTTFSRHKVPRSLVSSPVFLSHEREFKHANTWLPLGLLLEEKIARNEFEKLSDTSGKKIKSPQTRFIAPQKFPSNMGSGFFTIKDLAALSQVSKFHHKTIAVDLVEIRNNILTRN